MENRIEDFFECIPNFGSDLVKIAVNYLLSQFFFYSSKQLQNARLGSLSILWNVEEKNHVHQKSFMQTNGCMLKVKMWI